MSLSSEKIGSICKALRDSEMRTVGLLGCPMKVRKSRHFFLLEVFVSSHIENDLPTESRISCRLIFKCPKFYPRDVPEVHIRSKTNFPENLVGQILSEFDRVKSLYCGTQYIIPMVTSTLYMIEREERRGEQSSTEDESRNL